MGIQRGEEGDPDMRMERDSRAGVSSISRAATNSFKRYIEIILLVAPQRGRKIWPTLEIVLPITPKGGRKKRGNKTHVVIPDCGSGAASKDGCEGASALCPGRTRAAAPSSLARCIDFYK